MEKIFHPEKFDVKNLNPQAVGNVDEGAKYYQHHGPTEGTGHVTSGTDDDHESAAEDKVETPEAVAYRPPPLLRSLSLINQEAVMGE